MQSVIDLYHELARNWEDLAVWLVKSGPHHAIISGAIARLEPETVQDRTVRVHFILMVYLLRAEYYRLYERSKHAGR